MLLSYSLFLSYFRSRRNYGIAAAVLTLLCLSIVIRDSLLWLVNLFIRSVRLFSRHKMGE